MSTTIEDQTYSERVLELLRLADRPVSYREISEMLEGFSAFDELLLYHILIALEQTGEAILGWAQRDDTWRAT